MSESKYIGRGEVLVKKIFLRLFPGIIIKQQVDIKKVIRAEDYAILDQEIKNHKFDLVLYPYGGQVHRPIVVEVNYKHGAKAEDKWYKIFVPLIKKAGMLSLPINDYECDHLFHQFPDGTHKVTWQDFMDVMNCMIIVGIEPNISLE